MGGNTAGEMMITLDRRDADRLRVARARFVAVLAGTDSAVACELDRLVTPAVSQPIWCTALDRLDGGAD